MFKKPLSNLKTSAPLRSSDRRKFKSRVVQAFSLPPEGVDANGDNVGDLLVPDGIKSVKFQTHLNEPGVAYLSAEGSPLWFTVGKNSDDLIPTVYTLWKHPNLLPSISTPAPVIPVLIGGADLMIPGVVTHPPSLVRHALVSITESQSSPDKIGSPLAVGRLAVNPDELRRGGKGKAVIVLHTWKDHLWEMGDKGDVPEAKDVTSVNEVAQKEAEPEPSTSDETAEVHPEDLPQPPPQPEPVPGEPQNTLTPQEVSDILHTTLLQAIRTTLSSIPPSSFPMPSTTFYTTYLLPARPAPTRNTSPTPVDIKHSTHKSLTAFLKAAEKAHLLTLKSTKGDALVAGISASHPEVLEHKPYFTLRDAAEKRERKEEREEAGKKAAEMRVVEIWKPHLVSIKFFQSAGKDKTALYSLSDVRTTVNAYVSANKLADAKDQQLVDLDELLLSVLSSSGKSNANQAPVPQLMRREEIAKRLVEKMQPWHAIEVEGKDSVVRKGQLKPIQVVTKIRQGRKASTLITNFELYLLSADVLAEELRKSCASATSVSPVAGKGPNAGLEVLVQGRQIRAVAELLLAKGVPKKWIETLDLAADKK